MKDIFKDKKVAIVHYWLVGMRGGEKVLEAISDIVPHADIYTMVCDESKLSQKLKRHKITTSFLQRIGGLKYYQAMLPLHPYAVESFDLNDYDIVISSESGAAKAVITRPDSMHVCYCHSPMRYIWDMYWQYKEKSGILTRSVLSLLSPFLRVWDQAASMRVDYYIANSRFVAQRIKKYYRRNATVINPPVDMDRFQVAPKESLGSYYLCAGQITPYKRIDIAIDAFGISGKRLIIIGSGATDEMKKSAPKNVEFVDKCSDEQWAEYMSKCEALIYPGVEDFGIVPLESMASGRPVIALGRGGALDTVVEGVTGILFPEQTVASLNEAVEKYEGSKMSFCPDKTRRHAQNFTYEVFVNKLGDELERMYRHHLTGVGD